MSLARNRHWYILFLLLIISGCLEKDEGCLDPNSINLDVTADVSANCEYPVMTFSFGPRWGEESFRLNTRYALPSGDTLLVSNLRFFISNVSIGDGDVLQVFDSVMLINDEYFIDDLTLYTANTLNLDIGHVIEYGEYGGLAFDFGFSPDWLAVDTTQLSDQEANHPWLADNMRGAGDDRNVMTLAYSLINNLDTLNRSFSLVGPKVKNIEKEGQFVTYQANHATFKLLFNYKYILEEIDLRRPDSIMILDDIWNRLDSAISINPE